MIKKSITLIFVCFLIFGIMFSSIGVLAQEDDGSDDPDDDEGRVRERIRIREFSEEGNGERRIRIEREIEVDEEGRTVVKIKRKIITNGEETRIEIKIRTREEDGKFVKIIRVEGEFEGNGTEVETELEIDDDVEGNGSAIRARLSNGRFADIKILPHQASQRAREALKSRNFSLELKEKIHNNVPRVVYNIQANKIGRFLGIFKMKVKLEGDIDAETGEILEIKVPWWIFLVGGLDEPDEGEEEPEEPVCDFNNLDPCLDETSCTDAAGYWYNEICNTEAENNNTNSSI